MLTAQRRKDSMQVMATKAEREEFVCPECVGPVILHRGQIKIAHFAHKPPTTCTYGLGETEEHREIKTDIYDGLCAEADCKNAALERRVGTSRPDISARIKGFPVAIEVQKSSLTLDIITERTIAYTKLGVYVLWICTNLPDNRDERFAPSAWQRFLHQMCFGRVYFHAYRARVLPVHFGATDLYVEETDYGGGYTYVSRRFKTTQWGQIAAIANFEPKRSKGFVGRITTPPALLWMDPHETWWK